MPGVLAGDLRDIHMVTDRGLGEFAFTLLEEADGTRVVLATSPEAYRSYRAQFTGWVPTPVPELVSPHPEELPEFPSAWQRR